MMSGFPSKPFSLRSMTSISEVIPDSSENWAISVLSISTEKWYDASASFGRLGSPPGMRVAPYSLWSSLASGRYSLSAAPPENWAIRKMTNSAGLTGAMPISTTSWPRSMTSGGLVSASHLT